MGWMQRTILVPGMALGSALGSALGIALGLAALLLVPQAVAQESQQSSQSNLANQATNPVAPLIQLQLQNVFQPNTENANGNQFIIQPVIPVKLGEEGISARLRA